MLPCQCRFQLSIEELRVSGINVLDAPHLSSCIAQIVCQCALVQASDPLAIISWSETLFRESIYCRPPPQSRRLFIMQLQVDNVHAGMLKSSKQVIESRFFSTGLRS
jgi:hypothetical protein